jgi:hypothetical protein
VNNVDGLVLDGVSAGPSPTAPDAPAIVLQDVTNAVVKDCHAQPGTGTFLRLAGAGARDVVLRGNDTRQARTAVEQGAA